MNYAVILNNTIINKIIGGDNTPDYVFPFDSIIQDANNELAIGMYFENNIWHTPIPPDPGEQDISDSEALNIILNRYETE